MAVFNRLDLQQNATPYFLAIITSVLILFFHAGLEYSDFWISGNDDMSIGLQIQKQLSIFDDGNRPQKRTVVVYTGPTSLDRSAGKNELYLRNFDYFLDHKGVDCSQHDTIITLSNETYKFYMENENSRLKELMEECDKDAPNSLHVVKRPDKCYDLGSIHFVLDAFDLTKYDYFVYLNCGVVGPLWWDVPSVSWTAFFTSLLNDTVKMSGLSVNCHYHGHGNAHIQSMAFALDQTGLQIVRDSGVIYDCGMDNDKMSMGDKVGLIGKYEVSMTRAIFKSGYSIASWLWSRERNSAIRGIGQVHEPVVMNSPHHWCYDVWYVEPFLRVSSNYPRHFPSWNMTFFKTSRFITPDLLEEVGYELTNNPMKELVTDYSKGLASRFWAFQMMQSVFVE